MEKKKTSSIGKKPTTGKTNIRTEKDPDDLVHSEETSQPIENPEEDPDDAVHRKDRLQENKSSLADPDDLVHDDSADAEDR